MVRPKSIHVLRTRDEGGVGFYIGKKPNRPQVGDIRITYSVVPEQRVNIIGQRNRDGSLSTYSSGSIISRWTLLLVKPGFHNASEILQQAIYFLPVRTSFTRFRGVLRIFRFGFLGFFRAISFLTQDVLGLPFMHLTSLYVSYAISVPISIIVCLLFLAIAKIMSCPVNLL
jgi:hypothetical protein